MININNRDEYCPGAPTPNPVPEPAEVYRLEMETVIDDDGREALCDYYFCGNCDEEIDIYEWDSSIDKYKLRDTCPRCGCKLIFNNEIMEYLSCT